MEYTAFTNQGSKDKDEDSYGIAFYGDFCCFAVADWFGGDKDNNGNQRKCFTQL